MLNWPKPGGGLRPDHTMLEWLTILAIGCLMLAGVCASVIAIDIRLAKFLGEFFIVPRGVEHRPVAESEAAALLFEPSSTIRTGD